MLFVKPHFYKDRNSLIVNILHLSATNDIYMYILIKVSLGRGQRLHILCKTENIATESMRLTHRNLMQSEGKYSLGKHQGLKVSQTSHLS